jgi:hypothetical protein
MNNIRTYVGIEEVEAAPMTRGDYNTVRGWDTPQDENPLDEGFMIQRINGHLTWVPKDVFEDIYSEPIDNDVEMVDVKHDLLTTKYTGVCREKDFKYNSPHLYHVRALHKPSACDLVGVIHFQEGPIKEVGVNGVCNEDLIAIVIDHLQHFQNSEYSSRDNAMAITKLEEAMLWLRKRTIGRENRGVEGTHAV